MLTDESWPAGVSVSVRAELEMEAYSYSLTKAKASPDGEKATSWTHPPLGLANSPQIVPKGRRSPHTVGSGLEDQHWLEALDDRLKGANSKGPTRGVLQYESVCSDSLRIDALDERREDVGLGIRRTSSEEDVVRMPVDREDRGAKRLLDVLGDPPVVLLVKRAHGDGSTRISTYILPMHPPSVPHNHVEIM